MERERLARLPGSTGMAAVALPSNDVPVWALPLGCLWGYRLCMGRMAVHAEGAHPNELNENSYLDLEPMPCTMPCTT